MFISEIVGNDMVITWIEGKGKQTFHDNAMDIISEYIEDKFWFTRMKTKHLVNQILADNYELDFCSYDYHVGEDDEAIDWKYTYHLKPQPDGSIHGVSQQGFYNFAIFQTSKGRWACGTPSKFNLFNIASLEGFVVDCNNDPFVKCGSCRFKIHIPSEILQALKESPDCYKASGIFQCKDCDHKCIIGVEAMMRDYEYFCNDSLISAFAIGEDITRTNYIHIRDMCETFIHTYVPMSKTVGWYKDETYLPKLRVNRLKYVMDTILHIYSEYADITKALEIDAYKHLTKPLPHIYLW